MALAKSYLDDAMELVDKYQTSYTYYLYTRMARYVEKMRNIEKAYSYYNKFLLNSLSFKNMNYTSMLYYEIARFLNRNHKDAQLSNEYFISHRTIQDSLQRVNKQDEKLITKYLERRSQLGE